MAKDVLEEARKRLFDRFAGIAEDYAIGEFDAKFPTNKKYVEVTYGVKRRLYYTREPQSLTVYIEPPPLPLLERFLGLIGRGSKRAERKLALSLEYGEDGILVEEEIKVEDNLVARYVLDKFPSSRIRR